MRNRVGYSDVGASLIFGWLCWLKAWLGGMRLEVGGESYRALAPLPEGWRADWVPEAEWDAGWTAETGPTTGYRWWRAEPGRRAMGALLVRLGSRKLARQKWRRVFRVFLTFERTLRGDALLPIARVRRPDSGPEPPALQGSVSSGSRECVRREGWRVGAWQVSEWA